MTFPPGQGSSGGSGLLCGVKTQSYGSLAQSANSPTRQRRMQHQLEPGDTLQGLALKYGVTMEQIKRANRLYTGDSIFLKKTLYIPVPTEQKGPQNGLEGEAEGTDKRDVESSRSEKQKTAREQAQSHELSATDFLKKLDSKITVSKRAAVKALHNSEITVPEGETSTCSGSVSYQSSARDRDSERSPRLHQWSLLGPVPLTRTTRTAMLKDREDELFKL
ncbi:lysM and putative peptidoglycan-binding domain-containing protein 1 [Microcaecilia unicolor]|uniref:LysM and putative peptidoglycan-binding domain-containing protein 1 n=1 Tax=Microcaecilia unicolor TaxID=1415580 RepID=A0A6P7WUN0_9AMPH|nr:lysM and putative peptidoglycan-binding domain-containing protein 1 [Microcaecilia unicolor]XP_030044099.1 lysM and putative peptidoglycan-binding domain-containing protein 1 [Microcaecilia unicolor]